MNERVRVGRLYTHIQPQRKADETSASALERITGELGLKMAADLLRVSKVAIVYQRKNPNGLRSPSESQIKAHKRKDEELKQRVLGAFPDYPSLFEIMKALYSQGGERFVARTIRETTGLKKFSRTKVVSWLHELNIPIKKS